MPLFLIVWLALCLAGLGSLVVLRPDRHVTWLVFIGLLTAFAVWVSLPDNPGVHIDTNGDGQYEYSKDIAIRQGLDLAGGLKVLLEAELPEGQPLPSGAMDEVKRIVEDRIDALGALEPVIQQQGERRLIVELPGYSDPESAVALIRETAQLEFVALPEPLEPGTSIMTDLRLAELQAESGNDAVETPQADTSTPEAASSPSATGETEAPSEEEVATPEQTPVPTDEPVYATVMTGEILQSADVGSDTQTGAIFVQFTLTPEGTRQFGDYTTRHQGEILGIVLDGVVISSPRIGDAITSGQGIIEGDFTLDEASRLATQLRYGALPVPLRVDSTSTVGPTLGQISVQQSIQAGIIGIGVVLLFMLIYYRIPGAAAALALIVFALLNLSVYKLMPVTMTLPAITGFLISVGTAVDGNILIFERMKEELRAGKRVDVAVRAGFDRAWTSIRDSNLSTLIICAVLYGFGTSFGAGAVRGFAVTLGLGLMINLFTAVTVTRTFLHFIMLPINDRILHEKRWLLGL